MDFSLLPSLLLFAMVASITPGPNNLMLMASGVNFGLRATLPHLVGVVSGHALMTLALGLGLASLFTAISEIQLAMKLVGVLYVIYLARNIALTTSREDDQGGVKGKPLSFFQAVAFQWVNPKAWTLTMTALTLFSVTHSVASVLLVTLTFAVVNLPCVTAWTLAGTQLRNFLSSPDQLKHFNFAMAALLILSLVPVIIKA